jgi:hypothetical protein
MPSLEVASWSDIDAFRAQIDTELAAESSLCAAAQRFASLFVEHFPSIVLARVFAVVPFSRLPPFDATIARRFAERAEAASLLEPSTRVLSLLGSSGVNPAWCDRLLSAGHLAIPLLSQQLVEGIPMLAQLLVDLGVDLACLDQSREIESRRMVGSTNHCFYVERASQARDSRGRLIIASQAFVTEYQIETVFGMGGSYMDGTMVVAICFCTEAVKKIKIDRFPSVIVNFKMATTALALRGSVYPTEPRSTPGARGD